MVLNTLGRRFRGDADRAQRQHGAAARAVDDMRREGVQPTRGTRTRIAEFHIRNKAANARLEAAATVMRNTINQQCAGWIPTQDGYARNAQDKRRHRPAPDPREMQHNEGRGRGNDHYTDYRGARRRNPTDDGHQPKRRRHA